ncbi:MAG: UvrD-helicase domain-containing protein [Bryobacteraceae bacterium]
MGSLAPAYLGPDAEQRRTALAVDQSFLVKAPAGSGKTELLIQRFLALLATVPAPESVVAITFTRKAAGEMQDRILSTLERAQRGEVPAQPHERLSHSLALEALEQDRRMGWRLLEHPSRMRIQTIDSLCLSITGQMPWLARLGAQPTPTEQPEGLYLEAARRTVAQVEEATPQRAALETVLSHLDNNVSRACALIVDMLAIRDQWLPLVAGGEVRREDLEQTLNNAVSDGLSRAAELLPPELQTEILDLACFSARNLGLEHVLATWPGSAAEDHAAWLRLADFLMTKGDTWRRKVDKRNGFPAGCPVKKRFADLVERLESNEDLLEALRLVRALPPPRYSEDQWRVMRALFEALTLAAAHLKMVFRERGEVDFCEVAEAARQALGRPDAPSELALGIDARLQHLLVDEYQDTSVAQFDLIERLTAGWEPGDGRTLFLVGDPMQSIYRFRQAEVGLFLRTAAQPVGNTRPEALVLTANHRSRPGIVDRVNEIFSRILPDSDDIGSGAIAYSRSFATRPAAEEEAVSIHAFRRGEDAAEAALVVKLVRDAMTADPNGSVAVLVRARTHLPEIVAALRREGIPFRAIDIDPLSDRPVVRDLEALTRAMLHLGDRPSWLAILRAPWCGLTLSDLHALAGGAWNVAIWDLLRGDLSALSEEGRQRARRLRDVLETAFAERGRWPLRIWVERTWEALGGPACLGGEGELQDAEDYLDLLEQREHAGDLEDLNEFGREVERLRARPDSAADGRLQVLTIHKAKGLQFDTVIVPGLGRQAPHDKPALLVSAQRPRPDGGVDRLLATIRETGKDQDPVCGYLNVLERLKERHEDARLLYVACTRARNRLHLLGHARKYAGEDVRPECGSLLELLWPGLREEERRRFGERYEVEEPADSPEPPATGVPLRRLPLSWTAPQLPESVPLRAPRRTRAERPSYEWAGDRLRHVGTVVHAALQRIAQTGMDGYDPARHMRSYRCALANLGVVPAELDGAVRAVEQALTRALASPRGRWILAPRAEASSEYAVAGMLDGEFVHGTIDRLFVDQDGVRWIIDFKTSAHEGGDLDLFLDEEQRRYRPQLERYARLLGQEGRPLRLGLYFPLLDAWREWAFSE